MLFNRFFKQPKPNKFGYTPVYYDERKEDRERKMREAKKEGRSESGERDALEFRSKFREEVAKNRDKGLSQYRGQGAAKSNKMLFIIMIIIFGIITFELTMSILLDKVEKRTSFNSFKSA